MIIEGARRERQRSGDERKPNAWKHMRTLTCSDMVETESGRERRMREMEVKKAVMKLSHEEEIDSNDAAGTAKRPISI